MISDRVLLESRLLLVDDDNQYAQDVERSLVELGFVCVKATSTSAEALKLCVSLLPDLVLLNLQMPGMDGFELLKLLRLKEDCSKGAVQILAFARSPSTEARERALGLGASDFIPDCRDIPDIALRIRRSVELRHLRVKVANQSETMQMKVEDRTRALWESQKEIVERLTRIAAFRDDPTGEHCRRVGNLSADLARDLGMDHTHVELIRLAAPLHDLGKLGLPEALAMSRGMYNSDQKLDSQRHTVIGGDLLSGGNNPLLVIAALIARHHHENWDGTGYPDRLAGEKIPRVARIVTVADAFDAMTKNCEYRRQMEPSMAISEIALGSGKRYDPSVVMSFLKLVGEGRRVGGSFGLAA